ncbi:MAG: alpha-amylase family glycosyl hydrolase, partial [Spirochaetaceae bacterium]|nr:alpha-amylase family glycosyl hydrolase [Spirochaetaceae bacterium]
MARATDPSLRNQTIYSVFTRNHTVEGTFNGLINDIDRIASLGVDIIWLMPIHPIGSELRKGVCGSPYAVSDYRGINPDYGTMDDFSALLDAAHSHKLKVIIDVVFSHTSPDSLLSKVHPEWFWKNPEGGKGNRIGEWSDVVDLDYSAPDLWDYQIETLKGWLMEGVDGFRCDVAPLLPLSFWIEARDACAAVNPETIWLAETVEGDFINTVRRAGFGCLTDTETLRAFDISYEYDIYPEWKRLLDGGISLPAYIDRLRTQESILCDSDLKLRFLENHDQPRA